MADQPLDLATLKGTDYYRLLEYAVTKAVSNKDMSAAEIQNDLGIFPFKHFIGVIIEQHGDRPAEPGATMGVPSFRIMPQAFLSYLQYHQIEEGRVATQQAERHASRALWVAVGAIIVTALSAIASLATALMQRT
jgi:hypothetical protein